MHKGPVVYEKDGKRIIDCGTCGFKHLDPIPSDDEVNTYYRQTYFNQIRSGVKGRNLKHFLDGSDEAVKEMEWLRSTQFNDVHDMLAEFVGSGEKNLCDVGCGSAYFLKFMSQRGWQCIGIEPSENSNHEFQNVKIFNTTFDGFLKKYPDYERSFSAVTLFGVLEHATSPKSMIEGVKLLLKPGGVLFINVPNDFSPLQLAAMEKLKAAPWWPSLPDHINYFSMPSLEQFLESLGFDIIEKTTDFPMEMFLLMGENYILDPEIGSVCHSKRKSFELSLPGDVRRRIYSCLARQSIGRCCLVYARLRNE